MLITVLKKERVKRELLREETDAHPIFMTATPQFMKKSLETGPRGATATQSWQYCVDIDLDVVQVGHPSFYPVKILELPEGGRYTDDFGRSHVIAGFYDNFCPPFLLQPDRKVSVGIIKRNWEAYQFPDPRDGKWYTGIDEIVGRNQELDDPLSTWGVINGPLEPTWQLMSDGWPEFFILARKDMDLAKEIIEGVTDYCIEAGQGMIAHGADAIRIGDDYALNEGLMVKPDLWHELVYPAHERLVAGLKKAGGHDFPVILHSDGDITTILGWLGEGGIDALNPIQPGALDFKAVVEAIGHELSMTGAFDLRYFIEPFCQETREKIEGEIERLFTIVDEYNEGPHRTGFCIGPSHQVQPTSDVKTFEYWVRAVHEANARREG